MEPHYFWRNDKLGEGLLVTVEVVVRPRGDGYEWTGWHYESTGRTAEEAVDRATFGILRNIMDHFPVTPIFKDKNWMHKIFMCAPGHDRTHK
jgi:hypothetical protein